MKLTERDKKYIKRILYILVLGLSLGLIVYISIDTFTGVNFLENKNYMTFQLWVCIVFMIDFFVELFLAEDKLKYVRHRWFFLLLSIPYLNIINLWHVEFSAEALYFIRFIPLARGALALAIVIGYMTDNALSSLLLSYISITLSVIYFGSLIFFELEAPVNNMVPNYGAALWWAFMDATTIGSNIYPVTIVGKILAVILAGMGMMMFPLFTVYITNWVQRYNKRNAPALFNAEFTNKNSNHDNF
ncbi:MAG: potassium channel family protein [Muribaculum sp.]|nr:potassium channel family protein [Muribaculum sp.]